MTVTSSCMTGYLSDSRDLGDYQRDLPPSGRLMIAFSIGMDKKNWQNAKSKTPHQVATERKTVVISRQRFCPSVDNMLQISNKLLYIRESNLPVTVNVFPHN